MFEEEGEEGQRNRVVLPLSGFENGEAAEYVEVGWIHSHDCADARGPVRRCEQRIKQTLTPKAVVFHPSQKL